MIFLRLNGKPINFQQNLSTLDQNVLKSFDGLMNQNAVGPLLVLTLFSTTEMDALS